MAASVYDIPVKSIAGESTNLSKYKGAVLLVVNVASKCGQTPQYASLQKLYDSKHAAGLEILGFPSNDFMGQEPGSDEEIAAFCSANYAVRFPMFAKISVVGPAQHPLYKLLIAGRPKAEGSDTMREKLAGHGITPNREPEVLWNFEKFIIGRDGKVEARFTPDVTADDVRLVAALDAALSSPA